MRFCELEQLFLFDKWNSLIGVVHIESLQQIAENTLICSEKLKKRGRLINAYEIVGLNTTVTRGKNV